MLAANTIVCYQCRADLSGPVTEPSLRRADNDQKVKVLFSRFTLRFTSLAAQNGTGFYPRVEKVVLLPSSFEA